MGKNKYGKGYKKKGKEEPKNAERKGGDPIKSGKIRASHILVDKLSLAQQIFNDLKDGESFQKLTQQHSTCPSKNKGGDLGDFPKGKMVPEFWNACTKMKIGEISQPIKTQFGYHIIKRTG